MKCEICSKVDGKKRLEYSGLFICDKCLKEDKEHIKKTWEETKDLF